MTSVRTRLENAAGSAFKATIILVGICSILASLSNTQIFVAWQWSIAIYFGFLSIMLIWPKSLTVTNS
jgi:hypothetical protein